jgi:hypothetical protein
VDNPSYILLGQWISDPLATEGTISGEAYGLGAAFLESHADANLRPYVYAWVSQGDSATTRGEVVNLFRVDHEYPTGTPSGIAYTGIGGTSVSFLPGDRLIVEVGFRGDNASTTSYTGTMYIGGTGTPDMTHGETDLDCPPWVEFEISPGTVFIPDVPFTTRFFLSY